jgi:predicted amidophosphoribosyltransferase
MDFNWWRKVLDLILPRSAALQELEKVNSAEFWRRAEKSTESADQNIFTLFNYGDPLVRAAIWQIKYRNHQKIIRMLAEILYSQLLDELATLSQFANFTSPLLIPIPLSTPRLKSRGYNQSEELTRGIINLDKGKSLQLETGVLVKIKETPPQSSLSRAFRR